MVEKSRWRRLLSGFHGYTPDRATARPRDPNDLGAYSERLRQAAANLADRDPALARALAQLWSAVERWRAAHPGRALPPALFRPLRHIVEGTTGALDRPPPTLAQIEACSAALNADIPPNER